jgi:5-oxoprolinase (ATP-hydrolysing)
MAPHVRACAYSTVDFTNKPPQVTVDRLNRAATIDFTGTAPQQPTNFNAPTAIAQVIQKTHISNR